MVKIVVKALLVATSLMGSLFASTPAFAVEPCLSSFQDIEWVSGQPDSVTAFLNTNRKDYSSPTGYTEWEYERGKWWRYNDSTQANALDVSKAIYDLRIPTHLRAPFWFGAKDGDQIRSAYVYSGRECSTRTVLVSTATYLERDVIHYLTDYELLIKTISNSYDTEMYFRNLIPKETNLKLSSFNESSLLATQTYYLPFHDFLPEFWERVTLFYFPTKCFSTGSKLGLNSKWWRGGSITFDKSGPCTAKLFYIGGNTILKNKVSLYNFGTFTFNISDKENSKTGIQLKTTISCIKGKVAKKVTAVKPKCPAGYQKK